MTTRFKRLPPANSGTGAHWAKSYYCDICDESDYAHVHEGKDITPFYEDTETGKTICKTCKDKIEPT